MTTAHTLLGVPFGLSGLWVERLQRRVHDLVRENAQLSNRVIDLETQQSSLRNELEQKNSALSREHEQALNDMRSNYEQQLESLRAEVELQRARVQEEVQRTRGFEDLNRENTTHHEQQVAHIEAAWEQRLQKLQDRNEALQQQLRQAEVCLCLSACKACLCVNVVVMQAKGAQAVAATDSNDLAELKRLRSQSHAALNKLEDEQSRSYAVFARSFS